MKGLGFFLSFFVFSIILVGFVPVIHGSQQEESVKLFTNILAVLSGFMILASGVMWVFKQGYSKRKLWISMVSILLILTGELMIVILILSA
jgi:hypothetical protein